MPGGGSPGVGKSLGMSRAGSVACPCYPHEGKDFECKDLDKMWSSE